ncbi:MAG: ABC-2 family transporter protein [Polyangiaceae bacterium]
MFKFYVALASMSLKASMARRVAFLMQVGFMALNNVIFFVFWWLLFQRVHSIRGYSLSDLAVLYGTVAAGFGLVQALAGGVRHLGRLIDDGELDSLLAQPKPTLLYAMGMRSQASGIGDVLSGIGLLALSGQVSLARIPLALLAIAFSASVLAAMGTLFYSASFWLPRSEGLARQAWDILITCSLYPEPLFGGAIRLLLFSALPAGFVGYLPARLIRAPALTTLAALCAASLGFAFVAHWVFARGLRRYSSGSRFSVLG